MLRAHGTAPFAEASPRFALDTLRIQAAARLSAAMASAMASVRRAISACSSSTILPLRLMTPLPAFSGRAKASMIARAFPTSAAVGANTSLQMSIWLGMDQRLAVQAHVAALLALGPEAVEVLDVVVDAVDDVDAVGARRDEAVGEPGGHGRRGRG